MKAHLSDPKVFGGYAEAEIPAELQAEADAARTAMVEAAAEADDELLGHYLDGAALTAEEIGAGWPPAPGPAEVPAGGGGRRQARAGRPRAARPGGAALPGARGAGW